MHRILLVLVLLAVAGVGCVGRAQAPKTDLAAIGTNAAPEQLGTFSTSFKPGSDEGRDTNIKLASDAINQITVQPGEEFSFNSTVGPTTEKKDLNWL